MSTRLCLLVSLILALGIGPAQGALDPDLVGWWWFDEGSGTIAHDSSLYGNHGTLTGGAGWAPGYFRTALELDGVDGYVDVPHDDSLLTDDEATVMAWVNMTQLETPGQGYQGIVAKGNGTARSYSFYTTPSGMHFSTGPNGSYIGSSSTGGALPLNEWIHVCAMIVNSGHAYFVNGEPAGTAANGAVGPGATDTENVVIGRTQEGTTRSFGGLMDDVRIYVRGLTQEEIQAIMTGNDLGTGFASNPNPEEDADDVQRDIVLTWSPGEWAVTHDVYLGTTFEDVNAADRSNGLDVLVSQGQNATSYDPDGLLEIGQTYYWRIDEVNAVPAEGIFKGQVWSFTTEPMAYAVEGITVTTNATYGDTAGPENTINGSGLDASDRHSDKSSDMFLGTPPEGEAAWLLYTFDNVYKLYELIVWNYNAQFESFLGFSVQNMTVEYSIDGVEWTLLTDVEPAQGPGTPGYAADTIVDFAGVAAQYIRLTLNENYGTREDLGLSEVRFTYIPVQARTPEPADGATDVEVDTALVWRAGRDVVSHDVYLGTDPNALPLADSVTVSTYVPDELALGTTYYWQINEVQETDIWEGNIWSFATEQYLVIDDFESYNDEDNVIYETWIDGWINETTSIVGYLEAPFAEQTIVNSGRQSMPLQYENSRSPYYAEAEMDLGGRDLDTSGAAALRLFVAGQAPPYVEIDGTAIAMSAIGTDIWGSADQFRYAYMALSGDGAIVARVDGIYRSNEWVKGGVMIRESTEPGAPFAAVYLTGDYGVRYQARLGSDIDAVSDSDVVTDEQVALRAPVWVKIERVGNDFNGYYSADGETWTTMVWSPQTIAMGSDVTIGIALTSHDAAISTGGTFSNITTTCGVSGAWQMAEIGVAQPTDAGNDIEPLYVALEDSTGKVAVVTNPNPVAVGNPAWQEWVIPYSDLTGINLNNVSTMYIGIGDPDNPSSGGDGIVFIDDVGFGYPGEDE